MRLAIFILGMITLAAFSSCRKNGCTDPLAKNYDERASDDDSSCLYITSLIEQFNGTTSSGGTFNFEYNIEKQYFRWINELTGAVEEGDYHELTGEYSGLLELQIQNKTIHSFKSEQGFNVGYFPNNEGSFSLAFGASDLIDIQENKDNLYGDYIYFFMNAEGVNDDRGYKEWGILNVGNDNMLRIANFATGGEGEMQALSPLMLDSIGFRLPFDQDLDSFPEPWRFHPEHSERILIDSKSGSELTMFGSVSPEHSLLVVDVPEDGMGLAFKIKDYSVKDIAGDYRVIDLDAEGKALYGSVKINSDASLSYEYPERDAANDQGSIPGLVQTPLVGNCYYAGNFSPDGEELYLIFSGTAMFYLIIDSEGKFILRFGL